MKKTTDKQIAIAFIVITGLLMICSYAIYVLSIK